MKRSMEKRFTEPINFNFATQPKSDSPKVLGDQESLLGKSGLDDSAATRQSETVPMLSSVGETISRVRSERGISQEELAKKSGISVRTIRSIENILSAD